MSIAAYANSTTLDRNPRLQGALEDAGATVITVPSLRQAADTAMESAAYYFAHAQQGQGAIVLASNDQGFAQVLRYCGSLGCSTVAIGAPVAGIIGCWSPTALRKGAAAAGQHWKL